MRDFRYMTIAAVAAVGLALAGCGGGGSSSTSGAPVVKPMPTAYETAKAAIGAATTADAAQKAHDDVKGDVTAAQGDMLQAAVDKRVAALNMMARAAEQKTALMTAAGMIDTSDLSTQDAVDDAREAIVSLRSALANADDVSDADKAMYMSTLDDAVTAVDDAQGGIDTATRRTNQMTALSDASTALQSALAALSGVTPTQGLLNAANTARTALANAITDAADLTDAEKLPYQREADNAVAPIQTAQTAFNEADTTANNTTAAKLYAGISEPMGTADTHVDDDRYAAYDTAGTAIEVWIGDGENVPTEATATLTEDKKTTVPNNHGWTGQKFTVAPDGEGTYEAVVYSKVPDPTEGAKFNAGTDDGGYNLDATTGETATLVTSSTAEHMKISSARFDQSAGTKEFKLGTNLQRVVIPGSYHGVSGTYYCTAAASSTCAVQLVADGFALGGTLDATNVFSADGGTWTFKPMNPEARVTSMPINTYASYGWWLHTATNGDRTASAFAADRGEVDDAAGITALRGSATYTGGAAGKYALSSSTGGTNDAGHFTARATLEADFNTDMVTGTINNFMGVGGAKDWSVELMKSAIGDDGLIRAATEAAVTETDPGAKTKWTIGGTAATASGAWSGALKDNGDDGVPSIATGTFYSTYGQDGKMVGGFGVTKQ